MEDVLDAGEVKIFAEMADADVGVNVFGEGDDEVDSVASGVVGSKSMEGKLHKRVVIWSIFDIGSLLVDRAGITEFTSSCLSTMPLSYCSR